RASNFREGKLSVPSIIEPRGMALSCGGFSPDTPLLSEEASHKNFIYILSLDHSLTTTPALQAKPVFSVQTDRSLIAIPHIQVDLFNPVILCPGEGVFQQFLAEPHPPIPGNEPCPELGRMMTHSLGTPL